ncbi:MAG: aryldialkylphosphatase [Cyclobacteriaceae bacterium]|nr:MAG: aryldialkylphosphatase [Cyclobacteriaceae bacterium]
MDKFLFKRCDQIDRRRFIKRGLFAGTLALFGFSMPKPGKIITVRGAVNANKIGFTLAHEHILVDFIGAENYQTSRWNRAAVIKAVLPEMIKLKRLGIDTVFDFTPAFLGRDALLLQELSTKSDLNIVTNTGFYGAGNNKYLPPVAFTAEANDLAEMWVNEFRYGIDNTGIRPGFIKISVNPGSLSDLHLKLVRAAALTHLQTGLTIASHTGTAVPAFEQIAALKKLGVHPSAFIWVHAQNEKDPENYKKAVNLGAWVSLDGVQENNAPDYLQSLLYMKNYGLLHKVLVSQDAGWYEPGTPWNGPKRSYSDVHTTLIPQLKEAGFNKKEIRQIFEINPQRAFTIKIRTF